MQDREYYLFGQRLELLRQVSNAHRLLQLDQSDPGVLLPVDENGAAGLDKSRVPIEVAGVHPLRRAVESQPQAGRGCLWVGVLAGGLANRRVASEVAIDFVALTLAVAGCLELPLRPFGVVLHLFEFHLMAFFHVLYLGLVLHSLDLGRVPCLFDLEVLLCHHLGQLRDPLSIERHQRGGERLAKCERKISHHCKHRGGRLWTDARLVVCCPKRLDEFQELGLALLRCVSGDMVAQELQPCEAERPQGLSGPRIDERADVFRIRRVREDGGEFLSFVVLMVVSLQGLLGRAAVQAREYVIGMLVTEKVFSGVRPDGIQFGVLVDVHLQECYRIITLRGCSVSNGQGSGMQTSTCIGEKATRVTRSRQGNRW